MWRRKTLRPSSPATTSASCSSYKGIAEGVENSNFLVHTSRGYFILTLYEKRVAAAGPAVLSRPDGASARARHHLPAAGQEPRRRGAGHRSPAGRPRWSRSSMACGSGGRSPRIARRWATALARLHLAGRRFRRRRAQRAVGRRLAAALRRLQRAGERGAARPETVPRAPSLPHLEANVAARAAAGRHPRRPVSRQRVLPRRQAVRA